MNHPFLKKLFNFSDCSAVTCQGCTYTYADLLKCVQNQSDFLKYHSIHSGETVALVSDYSFKAIAVFLALMENRNIIVPITTRVETEQNERIRESFADKIILIKDDIPSVTEAGCSNYKPEIIKSFQLNGDSGIVLFSSGSTGKPKGMLQNLCKIASSVLDREHKVQTLLVFLMFDHIGGINTMFNGLSSGSHLILTESRDVSYVCRLIETHGVTVLPTSPTFLNLLLIGEYHKKYDLSSIELITYGTEPMQESLLRRLNKVFGQAKFLQTFGTSETGIIRTKSRSSDSLYIKFSDPKFEYRIVDNVLWLKSETQISGYLNAGNERFTSDGWFITGDLVEAEPDGFLRILGRKEELINVGGEKVTPGEVESVLLEIPEINDCMVYSRSHPITGEIVAADVVVRGAQDARELRHLIRQHCKTRIEAYKIPVSINVVDRVQFGERFKKMRPHLKMNNNRTSV